MAQRLCSACGAITLRALCQDNGYQHLPHSRDIFKSAESCDLCDLIRQAMHQNVSYRAGTRQEREQKLLEDISLDPIVMFGIKSSSLDGQQSDPSDIEDPLSLVGINVHMRVKGGEDIAQLSLAADPGSMAARTGHVVGRPLFQDPSCAESFDLLRRWFDRCVSNHSACHASFIDPEVHHINITPKPPTRVVDVGPPDGSEEPRLKVTGGTCARYATLSHCWGKHQIITTTRTNLEQHCALIRFANLSKTFQDAVVITRALGLRYLWIDSLCIIQDDPDDWKRESVIMGRIYQNAAITIAASWARDGREGCFIPRSHPPPQVRLPYSVDGVDIPGEFVYSGLFPDGETSDLTQSPLGQRGWITQEWMLSPRTIHYTGARLLWVCRTILEGEDGEVVVQGDEQRLLEGVKILKLYKSEPPGQRDASDMDSTVGFFENWCDVVCTYTSRQLTYESDKPVAILGLAKEISEGIRAEYIAGLFYEADRQRSDIALDRSNQSHYPSDSRLPETPSSLEDYCMMIQLFWFGKTDLTRPATLRHLPSWSWTSTIGEVAYHIPIRTSRLIASQIHIQDASTVEPYLGSGASLLLTAPIKLLQLEKYVVVQGDIRLDWHLKPIYRFYSRSTFTGGPSIVAMKPFYIANADSTPMGWVSLDDGILPREKLFAVLFSDNEISGAFDGFNVMVVTESGESNMDSERRFVRIGVGEILEKGWFDDAKRERILLK